LVSDHRHTAGTSAPEWQNSWQRRNRGNMAFPNTLMWITARLLEEEPAVSIGLL
jgi:hypothetical protein